MRKRSIAAACVMLALACHNDQRASGEGPISADNKALGQVIKSPKASVVVDEQFGIAKLEGRWRDVGARKHFFTTPTLNAVKVLCDRPEMTCTESIAWVYSTALDGERRAMRTVSLA